MTSSSSAVPLLDGSSTLALLLDADPGIECVKMHLAIDNHTTSATRKA